MDLFLDLDGTLIDSADGILGSFRHALEACGIAPPERLDRSLVGPPLAVMVRRLLGREDIHLESRVAESFKAHYDREGCLRSLAYPGVPGILAAWCHQGHRLIIVTNKRRGPTLRILEHLDLLDRFQGIHTPDGSTPPIGSKAELLGAALATYRSAPGSSLMVGDSEDDGQAARQHGIRFIHAAYGYGRIEGAGIPVTLRIGSLDELDLAALQGCGGTGYSGYSRRREQE